MTLQGNGKIQLARRVISCFRDPRRRIDPRYNFALPHGWIWAGSLVEVNLLAKSVPSREIGRGMIARGAGKIIFTASILTFQGGTNVPGYAASKGGIGQLTKARAKE